MIIKSKIRDIFRCCIFKVLSWAVFSILMWTYHTQNNASAQYFTGTVASSVGGAGRAGAEQGEETYLNPAALAHARTVSGSVNYTDQNLEKELGTQSFAVSFVDNNPDASFPGALQYVKKSRDYSLLKGVEETYWAVSGGNFITGQWAFGLTIYKLDQSTAGGESYDYWDGVLGLNYNPMAEFAMALVVNNVTGSPENVPESLRQVQVLSGGVNFIITDFFRARFDTGRAMQLNPGNHWRYQGGFESKVSQYFIMRLGIDHNLREEQVNVTAGFSFEGPRLKLDYALASNTLTGLGTLHSIDLRVPF